MGESEIREEIVDVGGQAVKIVRDYLLGKEGTVKNTQKVDRALKVLTFTTRVMHMNQHRELERNSQALRLINFLPKEVRQEYIKETNPTAKKLLLGKPQAKG